MLDDLSTIKKESQMPKRYAEMPETDAKNGTNKLE